MLLSLGQRLIKFLIEKMSLAVRKQVAVTVKLFTRVFIILSTVYCWLTVSA